jgi:hypothetical protein
VAKPRRRFCRGFRCGAHDHPPRPVPARCGLRREEAPHRVPLPRCWNSLHHERLRTIASIFEMSHTLSPSRTETFSHKILWRVVATLLLPRGLPLGISGLSFLEAAMHRRAISANRRARSAFIYPHGRFSAPSTLIGTALLRFRCEIFAAAAMNGRRGVAAALVACCVGHPGGSQRRAFTDERRLPVDVHRLDACSFHTECDCFTSNRRQLAGLCCHRRCLRDRSVDDFQCVAG